MRSAILLMALLAGCQPPKAAEVVPGELPRTGEVLDTVNGKPVTQSMLDALLGTMPDDVRARIEAEGQMDKAKEQVITQEVLYQEAIKRNLHQDEKVKTLLILSQRDALIEALLRKVVDEKLTDAAMEAWYNEHQVQFRSPEAQVSHIMLATEEEAKAVKAELDGGADFATLAAAKSTDTNTKDKGGDLGWLAQRQMPPDIGTPLFAAEKGTVVGPLSGNGGFHVFKVVDKRELKPFADVKDQVKSRMQQDVLQAYVKELVEAAKPPAGATVTPAEPGATPAPATPAPGK